MRTGLVSVGFLYRAARLCGLSIAATHVLSSTVVEIREICMLVGGERQECGGKDEGQLEIYSFHAGGTALSYHAFAHLGTR